MSPEEQEKFLSELDIAEVAGEFLAVVRQVKPVESVTTATLRETADRMLARQPTSV
jgi:hypothetical protein